LKEREFHPAVVAARDRDLESPYSWRFVVKPNSGLPAELCLTFCGKQIAQ
jgi:hypothetical protein